MISAKIIFYFFEVAAAVSAMALVFSRNVFYAALLLITCLLSVAGLYVLAFAEFVAVAQIMVYAGGVLVLIIFGIMLTARLGEKPLLVSHGNIFSGAIASIALLIVLCFFITIPTSSSETALPANTVDHIGRNLMTTHLIPFEIAGILLLVALVGAAVLASQKARQS